MGKKHVDWLRSRPEYHPGVGIDHATDMIFRALNSLGEKELKVPEAKEGYARGFMVIRESSKQTEASSIETNSLTHLFAITTLGRTPIDDEPAALDFRFQFQQDDTIKCTLQPPEMKNAFPTHFPNLEGLLNQFKIFLYLPITRELAEKIPTTVLIQTTFNASFTQHSLIDERTLDHLFRVKEKYVFCLLQDHDKQKATHSVPLNRPHLVFQPEKSRDFPVFRVGYNNQGGEFNMRSAAQISFNTFRLTYRHSEDIDAALGCYNFETQHQLWKLEDTTLILANKAEHDINQCRLPEPLNANDEIEYFNIQSEDEMSVRQWNLIQLFRTKLPSYVDIEVEKDLKKARHVAEQLDQAMTNQLPPAIRKVVIQYTNWPWLSFFKTMPDNLKKTERLLRGDSRPMKALMPPESKDEEDGDELMGQASTSLYDIVKNTAKRQSAGEEQKPMPPALQAWSNLAESKSAPSNSANRKRTAADAGLADDSSQYRKRRI